MFDPADVPEYGPSNLVLISTFRQFPKRGSSRILHPFAFILSRATITVVSRITSTSTEHDARHGFSPTPRSRFFSGHDPRSDPDTITVVSRITSRARSRRPPRFLPDRTITAFFKSRA